MKYTKLTEKKENSQRNFPRRALYFQSDPNQEKDFAMFRAFTDHPASVDETYGEHLAVAGSFSLRLLLASLACFVHALLPFLFVKTGSRLITELHDRMVTNRRRHGPAAAPAPATLDAAR
jgi:hypothetical protein